MFPEMLCFIVHGAADKNVTQTQSSKNGINVFFVNGNKPERIVDAVKRKKFHGTLFKGK